MNVFSHIEEMKTLIAARAWDSLEDRFQELCRVHAGETQTHAISKIPLRSYEASLTNTLGMAISSAKALSAKAIYFEFDMDWGGWKSWFFICQEFPKHWDRLLGQDYIEEIDGPEQRRLNKIYGEYGFLPNDNEVCITSYLIARTYASFGRAS